MVSVSRRSLLALGAALPLLGRLDWALAAPPPEKTDTVLLNYNESPYSPSRAAREAIQRGIDASGRYPYTHTGMPWLSCLLNNKGLPKNRWRCLPALTRRRTNAGAGKPAPTGGQLCC